MAGTENVETGVSGTNERRPALHELMTDARERRIDAIVVWRLDRFGRNLRHLVTTIEELAAAGVAFVSSGESIDTASPDGRLMLGIVGSFAQFERERLKSASEQAYGVPGGRGNVSSAAVSASLLRRSSASTGCPCARPLTGWACPPLA